MKTIQIKILLLSSLFVLPQFNEASINSINVPFQIKEIKLGDKTYDIGGDFVNALNNNNSFGGTFNIKNPIITFSNITNTKDTTTAFGGFYKIIAKKPKIGFLSADGLTYQWSDLSMDTNTTNIIKRTDSLTKTSSKKSIL